MLQWPMRLLILPLVICFSPVRTELVAQDNPQNHPWTLRGLTRYVEDYPNDSFGTYAALRLAEQQSLAERNRILKLLSRRLDPWNARRRKDPNWLGFTAGALAVQESLQLGQELMSAGLDARQIYYDTYSSTRERLRSVNRLRWSKIEDLEADKVRFVFPWDISLGPDGQLLIADAYNHRIFRLNSDGKISGVVEKVVQNFGDFQELIRSRKYSFVVGDNQRLFIVERWSNSIFLVEANAKLLRLAGDSEVQLVEKVPTNAKSEGQPVEIEITKDWEIYFSEVLLQQEGRKLNYFLHLLSPSDGQAETVLAFKHRDPITTIESAPGGGEFTNRPEDGAFEITTEWKEPGEQIGCMTLAPNGDLVFSEGRHLKRVDAKGKTTSIATSSELEFNSRRYGNPSIKSALSGDGGPVSQAVFQLPSGLAYDQAGNLYVADAEDHCIRKITPAGIITTIAGTAMPGFSGDGGQATMAQLDSPHGLVFDAKGNLWIADSGNGVIRRVDPQGIINTVAGKYVASRDDDREFIGDRSRGEKLSTDQTVKIEQLSGPEIPSLPFEEMLGDQKPEVSPLAKMVPRDFYYLRFNSLSKATEIAEYASQVGSHLKSQALGSAYSTDLAVQLRTQLALPDELFGKDFDAAVSEVVIIGTDLYWELGSDFTFLFKYDPKSEFHGFLDSQLSQAVEDDANLKLETINLSGYTCKIISAKDQSVKAYSVVLKPGVYVRSNSLSALQRVIQTLKKDSSDSLANSLDLQYLRTLMPLGSDKEDGFIFLSDDFIRSQVGPDTRIKQSRRLACFSNLYALQHARLLHQTQTGKLPESFEDLIESGSLNSKTFEAMKCAMGGDYSLDDQGCACCSVHRKSGQMTPLVDLKLDRVSEREQFDYERFVAMYSGYWQEYFDPIGMRIQFTPKEYRLETIVLPLIDNSIYTQMASLTDKTAVQFVPRPLPDETVLSLGVSFDKQKLLEEYGLNTETALRRSLGMLLNQKVDLESSGLDFREFFLNGIGNQIQIHTCDATPILTFNAAQDATPTSLGGLLVTSLLSPVYVVIPIEDVDIVNRFLRKLEPIAARIAVANSDSQFIPIRQSFATYQMGDLPVHRYSVEISGVGLHIHLAVINDQIIIANQPEIIQRIAKRSGDKQVSDLVEGNVSLKMSLSNWKKMALSHRLHLESGHCSACLEQLGPLTAALRSGQSTIEGASKALRVNYGMAKTCPSGGQYEIHKSNGGPPQAICSIHGHRSHPRQPISPVLGSNWKTLSDDFGDISASLKFTPDGLKAIIQVKRMGSQKE